MSKIAQVFLLEEKKRKTCISRRRRDERRRGGRRVGGGVGEGWEIKKVLRKRRGKRRVLK